MLHRLCLIAGQRRDEGADHPTVQPGQSAAANNEREELPRDHAVRPDRRDRATLRPQPCLEPGQDVRLPDAQLAHTPGVAAQHRPMGREVTQHRRDPEQVHISRLQRAGLLLLKNPPHASSTHAIATSSENSSTPLDAKNLSRRRQQPRYHTIVEGL